MQFTISLHWWKQEGRQPPCGPLLLGSWDPVWATTTSMIHSLVQKHQNFLQPQVASSRSKKARKLPLSCSLMVTYIRHYHLSQVNILSTEVFDNHLVRVYTCAEHHISSACWILTKTKAIFHQKVLLLSQGTEGGLGHCRKGPFAICHQTNQLLKYVWASWKSLFSPGPQWGTETNIIAFKEPHQNRGHTGSLQAVLHRGWHGPRSA